MNDPFRFRTEFIALLFFWLNINLNEIGYLYRMVVHRQLMKCELRQMRWVRSFIYLFFFAHFMCSMYALQINVIV